LSRQDGTKHKSSTLDKLASRPASSPAGFLFAVEHRADRRYLPNGIDGIDAARAFLEPKNLMTSWPIKLSQATVKAIAKAKPNSRAAPTIKNLPALGTEEAGLGLKLERGVGTPRYLTGRTCANAPFRGPFFMPPPRRANEGPSDGQMWLGQKFSNPIFDVKKRSKSQ
jgi:hypothetical protein